MMLLALVGLWWAWELYSVRQYKMMLSRNRYEQAKRKGGYEKTKNIMGKNPDMVDTLIG